MEEIEKSPADAGKRTDCCTRLRRADTNFAECRKSASYRLGHLLIHETRSLKDILLLFGRIKRIWEDKKRTEKAEPAGTASAADETGGKKDVSRFPHAGTGSERSRKRLPGKGVSVIVPSYRGESTIERTLRSVVKQTMPGELFEVLVIVNGEKDATGRIVEKFAAMHPSADIRIFYLEEPGVSRARNLGIEKAKFDHVVFLDDDDAVSADYLEALYGQRAKNRIVVSRIFEIDGNEIDTNNTINSQIMKCDDGSVPAMFAKCPSVLNMNACKLIPLELIGGIRFDEALTNGEDVVFFNELFARKDVTFKIGKEAVYFRYIRPNSLSRQTLSYRFHVTDRLKVIERLLSFVGPGLPKEKRDFIQSNVNAQTNFILKYLDAFPEKTGEVFMEIAKKGIFDFPFGKLAGSGEAKTLVISYCFTPFVDTGAIVMAKRIRTMEGPVDVAYNDMSVCRGEDKSLYVLADDRIDRRFVVDSATAFGSWESVADFAGRLTETLKRAGRAGRYRNVYSRVMWPASNFAAYEYKALYPDVKWTAEFSDPVLYDIRGKERYAKVPDEWLERVGKMLSKNAKPAIRSDNLFFWCEYLAYEFADEIVFTNRHQMEYMIARFDDGMKSKIRAKAVVRAQPTLPSGFYTLAESSYEPDGGFVNLAYFGTFYQTRTLKDVLDALQRLCDADRKKLRFHIFTDRKADFENLVAESGLENVFRINDYVGFLEFLNLTTKFDCLVVNDAQTAGHGKTNPYLPSKLSDYLGGTGSIWALYEEGSSLSEAEGIAYKSRLGRIEESRNVLVGIIEKHGGRR